MHPRKKAVSFVHETSFAALSKGMSGHGAVNEKDAPAEGGAVESVAPECSSFKFKPDIEPGLIIYFQELLLEEAHSEYRFNTSHVSRCDQARLWLPFPRRLFQNRKWKCFLRYDQDCLNPE